MQFKSRKEFNKHIEEHKQETIKKVKKHIRSLLLVNKHGLLLEEVSFEDNLLRSSKNLELMFGKGKFGIGNEINIE